MGINDLRGLKMQQLFFNKTTIKIVLIFILISIICLGSCLTAPKPATVTITRAGTNLDDGRLFVYLNGREINKQQPIGKGQTRTISIPNGNHRIWVKVDHFESDKINFTANNNNTTFNVSAQRVGGSRVLIMERNLE